MSDQLPSFQRIHTLCWHLYPSVLMIPLNPCTYPEAPAPPSSVAWEPSHLSSPVSESEVSPPLQLPMTLNHSGFAALTASRTTPHFALNYSAVTQLFTSHLQLIYFYIQLFYGSLSTLIFLRGGLPSTPSERNTNLLTLNCSKWKLPLPMKCFPYSVISTLRVITP